MISRGRNQTSPQTDEPGWLWPLPRAVGDDFDSGGHSHAPPKTTNSRTVRRWVDTRGWDAPYPCWTIISPSAIYQGNYQDPRLPALSPRDPPGASKAGNLLFITVPHGFSRVLSLDPRSGLGHSQRRLDGSTSDLSHFTGESFSCHFGCRNSTLP
jgi:hypothetical protein